MNGEISPMESADLINRIDGLDPVTHRALRERLIARYRLLNGHVPPNLSGASPEGTAAEPRFDSTGSLVIPFSSARRFHWWDGGQSISDTLREIEEKLKES